MYDYDSFVERLWVEGRKELTPNEIDLVRASIALAEEAGEHAGKVKRLLRGDGDMDVDAAISELGDCLFYLTKLAHLYGVTFEDIIEDNVDKLSDRKERGLVRGTGDDR